MAADAEQSTFLGPGAVLGNYRLLSELGRGGYGVVWEAEDTRDGSRVAVKTLLADLGDDAGQKAFARFAVEIDAVRRIKHPNVVAMHGTGNLRQKDGRTLAYFAMELIAGQTLDKVVRAHGPLEALMAAQILQQAAMGLHTAHVHGVVHRDIKPENIMLASDARVVVMDFGICKVQEAGNLTAAGTVVGTTRYLSPEQFLGAEVGAGADIFALGAVLFFLVTGRHLREHKDITALFRAITGHEDQKRLETAPVAEVLKRLLRVALAPTPEARFPNAEAMADALGAACLEMQGLAPAATAHLPPAAAPQDWDAPPAPEAEAPWVAGQLPQRNASSESIEIAPWTMSAPRLAPLDAAARPEPVAALAPRDPGLPTAAIPLDPSLFDRPTASRSSPPAPVPVADPLPLGLLEDALFEPEPPAPAAAPVPAGVETPCDFCGCFFPSEEEAQRHGATCTMRAWHDRNFAKTPEPPPPAPAWNAPLPPPPPPAPAWNAPLPPPPPPAPAWNAPPPPPAPRAAVPPVARGPTRPPRALPQDNLSELDGMYQQARTLGGDAKTLVVKGLEAVAAMCMALQRGVGMDGTVEHLQPRLVGGARRLLRVAATVQAQQEYLTRGPSVTELERQVRELSQDPKQAEQRRRRETQLKEAHQLETNLRTHREQLRGMADGLASLRIRLDAVLVSPEAQSPRLLGILVGEVMAEVEALLGRPDERPHHGPG